ncbi:MAG TPA: hypothetical protein VKY85_02785 [Candidatus Angelobacter sp.]|nr:hypothetical protein [Candidatus Angelobacter sp.]
MKLIQILVLVAAMAAAAAAQNTGSNGTAGQTSKSSATPTPAPRAKATGKGASSAQAPAVKLIVPKGGATSTGKSAAGTKSNSPQKTPVLTVKPAQKAPFTPRKPSVAVKATKPASTRPVTAEKKNQVKIVPQKTAGGKKPAGASETKPREVSANGRRDPFLSIIRNLPMSPAGPNCSVGKSCLFIPELELKGIAKDPDGQMLAVVMSNTHRAYFLRENDQVFNGSVQKITSDSVVFREFATDHLGRETAHEVVKRIPKS